MAKEICKDDIQEIQFLVRKLADEEQVNLIITAGGTGFGSRDVTPEALKPLFDKEAPGLVHAMFAKSFTVTPLAAMARLVAGIRKGSLLISVPGSPKGAVENAEAIVKLLPHACDLAFGANSRNLHAPGIRSIEKEMDLVNHDPVVVSASPEYDGQEIARHMPDEYHQHTHGHKHSVRQAQSHGTAAVMMSNDPVKPVTRRYRSSPYPMIGVIEAQQLIASNIPECTVDVLSIKDHRLVGSVVAHDIQAPETVPAFRASIVDGYAVIASDGTGSYSVAFASHATPGHANSLKSGQVARITTGAPVPSNATAVVMVEETELVETTEDGKEELVVKISVKIKDGDNIRQIGSDIKQGDLVLAKGTQITATGGEIGILASVGVKSIAVYTKPIVGVLSTGDELVDIDDEETGELIAGAVRDSNRPSLLATIRSWGFTAIDLGIAKDQPGGLSTVLRNAMKAVQVIVTTGGVSMGELDLLKPTIERSLCGTIHFGRVAMKPGKPTTFATVPFESGNRLIFALPGNPAAALVTSHLFVLPALRMSAGMRKGAHLPRIQVELTETIRLDSRPEYHRVSIMVSQAKGGLIAKSTGGQRSSRVGSLLNANGFLCLPAADSEHHSYLAGERTEAILCGSIMHEE